MFSEITEDDVFSRGLLQMSFFDLTGITAIENTMAALSRDTPVKQYAKGLPLRYSQAELENVDETIRNKLETFALEGSGVLVLTGINGTGKTYAVCSMINKRCEKGLFSANSYLSCKYEVCPMLRASRSFSAKESEYELLQRYYQLPFLVLDEVGKGDDRVIEKMFVSNVLSARYDNKKPTVIATNLLPKEISELLGLDIKSRLNETGTVIVLNDKNWRI